MKKILSVAMVVALLLSALSIVSCAPPCVSQEEYNKVVAERDDALERIESLESKIETLQSKIEEASKYAGFMAWFTGGPKAMEPEAMEQYYASLATEVMGLGDFKAASLAEELRVMAEEMKDEGATWEEIYVAQSTGLGKDLLTYLAEEQKNTLCWPCWPGK